MWETWPWILLSVSWHSFQILFSKLQQKGRVMCTAPSRIPIFWQFFIFWLCCTLIKCLFFPLNIVSRFPGVDPNIGANVLCWESLLSASIASGLCFLCPYLQPFPHGSLHSTEWLLPSPMLPVPPWLAVAVFNLTLWNLF